MPQNDPYLKLQVWTSQTGGTVPYTSMVNDLGYGVSNDVRWTSMWSFSYWLQACLKDTSANGGNGPCTGRH
jgi:hypothetical protein